MKVTNALEVNNQALKEALSEERNFALGQQRELKEQVASVRKEIEELQGETSGGYGLKTLYPVNPESFGISAFVLAESKVSKKAKMDLYDAALGRLHSLNRPLWNDKRSPNTIVLRACYKDFQKLVKAHLSEPKGEVLIAGSRGIGKSVFGLLMVLTVIGEGRIILYEHKGEKMLIISRGCKEEHLNDIAIACRTRQYEPLRVEGFYQFDSSDADLFLEMARAPNVVHVQDLGDDKHAQIVKSGYSSKLILASPNNKQLSTLHSNIGLLKLYMPRWSFDELNDARVSCFSKIHPNLTETALLDAYNYYGEIPLYVLEWPKEQREAEILDQLSRTNVADVDEMFRRNATYLDLPYQRNTSKLIHVIPTIEVDPVGGNYKRYTCRFASEDISRRLAGRFI